jgi:hypothetical protein
VEIAAASVAANALRVGLNVAVGRNRPVIEFYYQVHNDYGPVQRIEERTLIEGMKFPASEHRSQNIFVSFFAVNIGSLRAEQITFTVDDQFRRRGKMPWGKIFGTELRQMAPGQTAYLLRLDDLDLFAADPGGESVDLILKAQYRAPEGILNWASRRWARFRSRSQYSTDFIFNGKNIATDLPPPKYA